ncbi:MAG: hypothetical protein ACXWG8_00340 [Usitatibacter sp.]
MAGLINDQLIAPDTRILTAPKPVAEQAGGGSGVDMTTQPTTTDAGANPLARGTGPAPSVSQTGGVGTDNPATRYPDATATPAATPTPTPSPAPSPAPGLIGGNLPPPAVPTTSTGTPSAPASPVGARTMVSDNAVTNPVKEAASNIGATMGSVSDNMTVQGQLEKLLDKDSPLMQQARSRALIEANNRGLINSSMAQQAGEEAAIQSALPIAQQDANTFTTVAGKNQDASNSFSMADKNFENTQSLTDFQQQAQRAAQAEAANQKLKDEEQQYQDSNSMFERDNALKEKLTEEGYRSQETQANIGAQASVAAAQVHAGAAVQAAGIQAASAASIAAAQGTIQREAMNLDATTRTHIAELTTDAQTRASMAGLQQNTVTNYANQMTQIMGSQMEPDDKQRALSNLTAIYGGSPYMPISLNLSALPSTTGTPTPTPTPSDTGGGG